MQKVVFFFPSLTHLFITALYRRFSTDPAQARKQSARTKTCFSFKIKDRIILFEFTGILKNNLRLFKLDSNTSLMGHSAVTSTKWRNMKATPTLILFRRYFNKNYWERPSIKLFMTCDIKLLKPVLAHIVTRHGKKSFPKPHFSSFVIKQRGNLWKLRWVNSTIRNNETWLILISYVVSMSTLPAFV